MATTPDDESPRPEIPAAGGAPGVNGTAARDALERTRVNEASSERTLSRLNQLGVWIERIHKKALVSPPVNLQAALQELETVYEELRVAEEELRSQNEGLQTSLEAERERYRVLFDLAPDGYIVTDHNGVIREANRAAGDLLWVAPRFLIGKPFANYIAAEQRVEFRQLLMQMPSMQRAHWEAPIQPRGRRAFPASLTVSEGEADFKGDTTKPVLRWLIRNISEQERTARQLAEVNQILNTLVNAAPLPIMVLNRKRDVTLWNPAAERLFGWTADEVIGKPFPIIPLSRKDEFEKRHEEVCAGKSHQGVETQRQNRDGSLLDVAVWTAPLRDQIGMVMASVWLLVDISEHKRTEAMRRQLLERVVMAQEEERARISRDLHDHLGQYLTGIMLGLQALEGQTQELPFGERRSNAEQLARLRSVVDELMLVSHRQAWELRPAELDDMGLPSAVAHYVSDWASRHNIDADFHTLGFEGKRLDGVVEIALYRILQEALTNVLRHAQARRVDVLLELTSNMATAIVEDDGRGFEAPVEETIQKGRLGLTGMSERLALVGGTLEIESSPGRGTTVFARVPNPVVWPNDSDSPDLDSTDKP